MLRNLRVYFLVASTLTSTTSAFAQPAATAPAAAPAVSAAPAADYTVIKLGGEDIKLSEINQALSSISPGGAKMDFNTLEETIRQRILVGLVSERLIYQESIKASYDKNEEVKKRLADMQKQVMIQSFMEDKAKSLVTDAQLKAAYDQKLAAEKGQEEAKARHILVASEDEAKKLSEQLKKGGDFDKLAKEKSTDKASGVRGGDLGWFTKDKMVPEFADAVFKLKKGEVSAPVKSAFGWHIIKLDDRRPVTPPTFEQAKEELKNELTGKSVQAYVESLLKTADVKYLGADGKEKPFSRSLAEPEAPAKP